MISEILTTIETTETPEQTTSHPQSTEVITTDTMQTTKVITLPQTTQGKVVEKLHNYNINDCRLTLTETKPVAVYCCISKLLEQRLLVSQIHCRIYSNNFVVQFFNFSARHKSRIICRDHLIQRISANSRP